jgi:hypothetical protein
MEKVFAMTVREEHVLNTLISNTRQADKLTFTSISKVDRLNMNYYIGFDKVNLDLLEGYDFLYAVTDGIDLDKALEPYDLGILINLMSRFGV